MDVAIVAHYWKWKELDRISAQYKRSICDEDEKPMFVVKNKIRLS